MKYSRRCVAKSLQARNTNRYRIITIGWMSAVIYLIAVSTTAAQDALPPSLDAVDEEGVSGSAALLQRPEREIPEIDSKLSGWNDAGDVPGQPGEQIRANWVMLTATGEVHGTVLGDAAIDVSPMRVFALRNGFVTSQTRTERSGNFVLEGLTSGIYTIVGYSPHSIFAYGMNAVDYRSDATHTPRRISTRSIATGSDKIRVGKLIAEYSPGVRFRMYGQYPFGEQDLVNAAHFGWEGLADFDQPSKAATSIQSRTIYLDNLGSFHGRVHQIHNLNGRPVPVQQTKMLLVQRGIVVAEAGCNRLGIFDFSGVTPGEYGLVGVGSDGFAAIGIRLANLRDLESIPARDASFRPRAKGDRSASSLVGLNTNASSSKRAAESVDLTLIQSESIGWLNHFVASEQFEENISRPRPVAPVFCHGCQQMNLSPGRPCACGH